LLSRITNKNIHGKNELEKIFNNLKNDLINFLGNEISKHNNSYINILQEILKQVEEYKANISTNIT